MVNHTFRLHDVARLTTFPFFAVELFFLVLGYLDNVMQELRVLLRFL